MLSYLRSNVIAVLALVVALGGTSYAAVELERNSITSRELAENAVGASELAKGAAGVGQSASLSQDLRQDPVVLEPGLSQIATQTHYTIDDIKDRSGDAFINAAVEIVNGPDDKGFPAVVNLQVLVDGIAHGPAYTFTVPDGTTTTAPAAVSCNGFQPADPSEITCNGVHPGDHVVAVEVVEIGGAEGVSINDRVLDVVSFGPIFHPPK